MNLDDIKTKCKGGWECVLDFALNPPLEVLAASSVSFWSARQFAYFSVGLSSGVMSVRLALLSLSIIDTWITFFSARSLMQVLKANRLMKDIMSPLLGHDLDGAFQ